VDVGPKLHVTIEVEVVAVSGEADVLEVVLEVEVLEVDEVEEKNMFVEREEVFEDLQVVRSGHVVVDKEADEKSRLAVEEMLVEGMHISMRSYDNVS